MGAGVGQGWGRGGEHLKQPMTITACAKLGLGLVCYVPGCGWVGRGDYESKANLARFQMKLPTGAKLGKIGIQ